MGKKTGNSINGLVGKWTNNWFAIGWCKILSVDVYHIRQTDGEWATIAGVLLRAPDRGLMLKEMNMNAAGWLDFSHSRIYEKPNSA